MTQKVIIGSVHLDGAKINVSVRRGNNPKHGNAPYLQVGVWSEGRFINLVITDQDVVEWVTENQLRPDFKADLVKWLGMMVFNIVPTTQGGGRFPSYHLFPFLKGESQEQIVVEVRAKSQDETTICSGSLHYDPKEGLVEVVGEVLSPALK